MRIAAYARFSSDNQRDASIEDQLRNIRAECLRRGWPPPDVYSDAAISGSRDDRPGYRKMMVAAEARQFDLRLSEARPIPQTLRHRRGDLQGAEDIRCHPRYAYARCRQRRPERVFQEARHHRLAISSCMSGQRWAEVPLELTKSLVTSASPRGPSP